VGAITVTKTNMPEQDAEALGGTIEITPKTPPLNGKPFFDARLGTGYEPLRGTSIQDLSLSAGGRFGIGSTSGGLTGYSDRPFTLVVTATYYGDKRGIDDVEPSYLDDGVHPSLASAGWDQRYYQYNRNRHGLGFDLGYQPDATQAYYVRAFDAGYTETVLRNRLTVTPDGSPSVANGVFTDGLTANGFDKTLRDEKERINNKVFVIGGRNTWGDRELDYRIGHTRGSYDKLYDYNSDFNYTPAAGTITYANSGAGNTPKFTVSSGVDYLDPANYTLAKLQNSTQTIHDQENSTAINYKSPANVFGFEDESVKVGLSGRARIRTAVGQPYSYTGLPALPLNSASSGGNVNFYNGQYDNGPQMTPGLLQNLFAADQTISPNDAVNAALQQLTAKENVYAAYGQYQMSQGHWGVLGGLRVEATHAHYAANAKGIDSSGNAFVAPVSKDVNYTNLFPSIQARYELQPSTFLRAIYSTAIARPGFNQVTPSLNINPSSGFVSQGNPNLKPITSNAFDVAIEKYLPDAGIISMGLFDKEFRNYIVNSVTNQTFPNNGLFAGFVGVAHVISYANSSNARARGAEFNYEQRFKTLPGIWSGLGTNLNYTFVDSKFEIRPGEFSSLPSTSRHTLNAAVFYERDGLNLRLATYYLSRNLWAVGAASGMDVFSEPRLSVDIGASYAISKTVSIFLNGKNLTNTPLRFSEGSANKPIQREFYGPTYQVGLNVAL